MNLQLSKGRFMSMARESNEERKKKKQKSNKLEAEIFQIMEKSLKAALDAAMRDLFKEFM